VKRTTEQMIKDIESKFGVVGVYAVERYLEMEAENAKADRKRP
jgi:phosphoribosylaminoimidazole carboxylase (NCAIR synthetase)